MCQCRATGCPQPVLLDWTAVPGSQGVLYRPFAGAGTVFLPVGYCTWLISRWDGTKWLTWLGQESKLIPV